MAYGRECRPVPLVPRHWQNIKRSSNEKPICLRFTVWRLQNHCGNSANLATRIGTASSATDCTNDPVERPSATA